MLICSEGLVELLSTVPLIELEYALGDRKPVSDDYRVLERQWRDGSVLFVDRKASLAISVET
jgi:hypothetical protein